MNKPSRHVSIYSYGVVAHTQRTHRGQRQGFSLQRKQTARIYSAIGFSSLKGMRGRKCTETVLTNDISDLYRVIRYIDVDHSN